MCGVHLSQCPHSVFAQARIVASYLVAELRREDVIVWSQSLCAQTSVCDFLLLETVNEETVYDVSSTMVLSILDMNSIWLRRTRTSAPAIQIKAFFMFNVYLMLISVFLSRFQSVCAHVHLHQPAVGVNIDVLSQVPSASATHAEVVNAIPSILAIAHILKLWELPKPCKRTHIVFCLEGQFIILQRFILI